MPDRYEPTLYPNGIRPAGNTVPGVAFDVKCMCGATAIVVTSAWGMQCAPCHAASARAIDEEA